MDIRGAGILLEIKSGMHGNVPATFFILSHNFGYNCLSTANSARVVIFRIFVSLLRIAYKFYLI